MIHAERFAAALYAGTASPVGAIDQFVDSTDALGDRAFTRRVVDCPDG